jgi:NAD dependent epimerase/dehydratase family enzyme
VHDGDLHAMIERALTTESMQGIYVASSPSPVSQAMFMRELRRAAGGLGALGLGLPAPAPLVRLGAALVLRTDPDLALYGRYVMPTRLLHEGFAFKHPTLAGALGDILGN